MTDWNPKANELFLDAVEIPSVERRQAFLDENCGTDVELRANVESLLAANRDAGSFLQQAALATVDMPPTADMPPMAERPGTVIGPYKLLEQIGIGGFGVVYLAEQRDPVRRRVALKVIKPGMDTREVIARFEAERQALALMDHPNIAHVLDAGATESGRPYFVMELVKGVPITEYCDQCNLATRTRLELFVSVCQAIQHAHQKGIIHRDVKPSNVLVAMQDGRPAAKIIDFGVAKAINQRLTEQTLLTGFAQMIGTPLYMSPEQAEMSPMDIDTRSDIYSLGVLLYELLTGTTPFERSRLNQASYDEIRRIIREEEPPKPSHRVSTLGEAISTIAEHRRTDPRRLSQQMRGDLDWIVMKALEKDRTCRYETASSLAADVERFLNDEAVEARPPSATYKFRKFARRNRVALTTASLILVTALVGLTVSTALIAQERNAAFRARDLALENLYFAHVQLAHQDWQTGHIGRMHKIIDTHVPNPKEPDLRGWEWYYLLSLCHRDRITFRGHTAGVMSARVSPDGQRVVSGSDDRTVRIWDLKTAREIAVLYGHKKRIWNVSWSSDGQRIASAGDDGNVIVWNVDTGAQEKVLNFGVSAWAVAWSPDGQRIAAGGIGAGRPRNAEGAVKIWDAKSGKELHELIGDVGVIRSLAWSPDGRYLVCGENFQGRLQVWEPATGKLVKTFSAHDHFIGSVTWSPDGRQFASASLDQTIKVWEVETWKNVLVIHAAHRGIVNAVSWSGDGSRLASAGEDGLVKIWDVSTGEQVSVLRGHRDSVQSVCWSPNDRGLISSSLISSSEDGTTKLWDLSIDPDVRAIAGGERVAWSPDGRLLAAGGKTEQGTAKSIDVFEAETGRKLFRLPYEGHSYVGAIAWSPDGQRLAVALAGDGLIKVWDLSTRRTILSVATHEKAARSVAWSPDSRLLASAGIDGLLHLWNVDAKRKILTFREHKDSLGSVVWSPDGKRVASASWDRDVKIWDPKTGRVILDLRRPEYNEADGQYSISWSPSGDRLAAGCRGGEIIVWDAFTGHEVLVIPGHTSHVRAVSWSPDGKRLASGGYDRFVKIWDAESGRELLALAGHKNYISAVAWSPDGKRLATGDIDVKIWDASIGYKQASQ